LNSQSWEDAIDAATNERVRNSLSGLYSGHQRFLDGKPQTRAYNASDLQAIATAQQPIAAIVACSDSRVAPEILFDQPLGGIFASRVPGNVASDSAKWMLDIAVAELKVPLVLVLGHTGCLAVGQIVEGKMGSSGGSLRFDVQMAVYRARLKGGPDLYRQAVIENVWLTVESLRRDSFTVQRAIERGEVGLLGGYYDMQDGQIRLIA